MPPFNAYPAVIGAAIGGMIIAAILTVLLFIFIVRNRNNNPRKCEAMVNYKYHNAFFMSMSLSMRFLLSAVNYMT